MDKIELLIEEWERVVLYCRREASRESDGDYVRTCILYAREYEDRIKELKKAIKDNYTLDMKENKVNYDKFLELNNLFEDKARAIVKLFPDWKGFQACVEKAEFDTDGVTITWYYPCGNYENATVRIPLTAFLNPDNQKIVNYIQDKEKKEREANRILLEEEHRKQDEDQFNYLKKKLGKE